MKIFLSSASDFARLFVKSLYLSFRLAASMADDGTEVSWKISRGNDGRGLDTWLSVAQPRREGEGRGRGGMPARWGGGVGVSAMALGRSAPPPPATPPCDSDVALYT